MASGGEVDLAVRVLGCVNKFDFVVGIHGDDKKILVGKEEVEHGAMGEVNLAVCVCEVRG